MRVVALVAITRPEGGMHAEAVFLLPCLPVTGKTESLLPPGEQFWLLGLMRSMTRKTVPFHGWIMPHCPFQ